MRLLVTGAAGFIGSNFIRHWQQSDPDDLIIAYDLLTYAGNRSSLDDVVGESCIFLQGDINDSGLVQELLRDKSIDVIVNFAAESHNSQAVLNPGQFFRTNVLGTQNLLECARQAGIQRFHHISTCEVYGDLALDSTEVFTEESPYRPSTPYNASKAGADHAVRAYFETFSLPITISTCCNNYGAYQFPEKVVPLFTTRALDNQQLPIYESSANRREWIHVDDHCRAIELIIKDGRIGETYNVGTGREASVMEIADAILAQLDKGESLKSIVPDRPGHDRRYLLDSSKISDALGWEPKIDFSQGLWQTVNWYCDNRSWWEPLKDKAPVAESSWRS